MSKFTIASPKRLEGNVFVLMREGSNLPSDLAPGDILHQCNRYNRHRIWAVTHVFTEACLLYGFSDNAYPEAGEIERVKSLPCHVDKIIEIAGSHHAVVKGVPAYILSHTRIWQGDQSWLIYKASDYIDDEGEYFSIIEVIEKRKDPPQPGPAELRFNNVFCKW